MTYSKRLDGIFSTWASPVADADGNIYFATAGKNISSVYESSEIQISRKRSLACCHCRNAVFEQTPSSSPSCV